MLIESLWSSDQVQIVFAEPGNIHLDHLFPPTMPDILGWKPQGAITTNEDIVYAYNGRIYNRLSLSIALNREPGFFLDKIITGCAMLVVMCILLFLLTAEEADRVMGAMAVFAGLVAYLFVASQCQLPCLDGPAAHSELSSAQPAQLVLCGWKSRELGLACSLTELLSACPLCARRCLSFPLQTHPLFPTRPLWTSS